MAVSSEGKRPCSLLGAVETEIESVYLSASKPVVCAHWTQLV